MKLKRRGSISGMHVGKPSTIDYEKYKMHFCGAPTNVIEKTFENTTQMGRKAAVKGMKLWRRHKAPNPALNIPRRNETVATDTIYGPGCPAVDNGSTAAQFFVGRKSGFCAVEGIGKSDKRFPVALMNHIRKYGAMDQIISDNAKAQISERVQEILNVLQIKDWSSEPHRKNQNFAERIWRDVKPFPVIPLSDCTAWFSPLYTNGNLSFSHILALLRGKNLYVVYIWQRDMPINFFPSRKIFSPGVKTHAFWQP